MPLMRLAADAFGAVTICLVAILILVGFLCIVYCFYFQAHIRSQGFFRLGYFGGPWIIRIIFVLFIIWWGVGEVTRLSFLRQDGRVLNALNLKLQENLCRCYVVSNLGFVEPCLFLTIVFLLRAPLQSTGSGILNRKWNAKTAGCVILCGLPMFILQFIVILLGSELNNDTKFVRKLPHYFTRTSVVTRNNDAAVCTYPLLSTTLLGLFASLLTCYLFWVGMSILKLVINKGLQRRVYTLIFSVSSFLPLRILLIGLTVLSKPEHYLFEALSFSAFLASLCCFGVCIPVLVYFPLAESLALGNLRDLEARRIISYDHGDTISLIANPSHLEESSRGSV